MDKPVENNLHFLQFENRKIPKFFEAKGNMPYIRYGEKNDYPYYLIDLYIRSSYHSAIVNGKVDYIAGAGWTYDKTGIVSIQQKALAEKLIKQPFADTNLNETTKRIAKDFELFNGFAILVKWSKNRRSATLQHIDFANIRTNADNTEYYYTRGWYTQKNGVKRENKNPQEEPDWKVYKPYDPENRDGDQIYYYKVHHPDQYVYPLPVYVGGVTWIENHVKYTDFQYKNISSSFSPAKIINIYGNVPPEDKQEEITEGIKKNFTGEEGERIVVGFHPSKELGIEAVDSQVSDQSQLYEILADQALQNIFTVHGVTSPMLFGIRTEGQLGGRNEMLDAYELFYNSYIKTRQHCIEYAINEIAEDIGIGINLRLMNNTPLNMGEALDGEKQKVLNALNTLNPTVATKVLENMSAEEIRGLVGLKGAVQRQSQNFSDARLDIFAQFGVSADGYDIIRERDIPTTDPVKLEEFERDYIHLEFADVKARSLDRSVLDLLSKDPYMDIPNLAKAIKSTPADVKNAIERLLDRDLLSPAKETIGGDKVKLYDITKAGSDLLSEQPAKTESYKVMYRYGLAAGFKDEIIPGTRDFCRKLIGANKLYSRDEINTMSEQEGRNVWTLRGGWYTNSDGIHEPQCRHTWKQVVVKER